MKTFTYASLAVAGANAASFEVRGLDSTIQMHRSFLKVYNQADLTPAWVAVTDNLSFEHGRPQTHTIVLDRIADTCAGTWGNSPCVPFGAPAHYPAMFYCGWQDEAGGAEELTGPFKPTLHFIEHNGAVLGKEARLACMGPSANVANRGHRQQLKVYFGAGASRTTLEHIGREDDDKVRVIETAAPTMAPTHAPTMAPTNAPTMAPTQSPTPSPTPKHDCPANVKDYKGIKLVSTHAGGGSRSTGVTRPPSDCKVYVPTGLGWDKADYNAIGNMFGGSSNINNVDMDADGGKCTNYDALMAYENNGSPDVWNHASVFNWSPVSGSQNCNVVADHATTVVYACA